MNAIYRCLLVAAILVPFSSCTDKQPQSSPVVGPPDWSSLSTTTIDGQPWALADPQGKVILVNFWATWCGPCKFYEPWLKEVHKRFGQRNDFVMVGVTLDEDAEPASEYCLAKGIRWTQLHEPGKERANSVARAFGVEGIPAIKLILRDGHVIELHGIDQNVNPVEAALEGMRYDNSSWFRENLYGGRQEVTSFLGPPSAKETVAGKEMWKYSLTKEGGTQAFDFEVGFRDTGEAYVASYSRRILNPGILKVRVDAKYWSREIEPQYPAARCRYGLVAKPAGREYPRVFINPTGGSAGGSAWKDVAPQKDYSVSLAQGDYELLLLVYDRDRFEQSSKGTPSRSVLLRSNVRLAGHKTTEVTIDSPPAPPPGPPPG